MYIFSVYTLYSTLIKLNLLEVILKYMTGFFLEGGGSDFKKDNEILQKRRGMVLEKAKEAHIILRAFSFD